MEIQQKDIEIRSFGEREKGLTSDVSRKDERLGQMRRELETKKEELKKIKVKTKDQEIELDSNLAKIKKMEIQLFQLKTNEEYQALHREIESIKDECSAVEDVILDLMERIEEAQHEIAEREKSVADGEEEILKARETLAREKDGIAAEIHRLEGEKKIIASPVDPLLIERYEKIMSHRRNRAIVPVIDNICQGCYTKLPRHTVDEVRASEKPIFCEECSRILYLDNK